MAMAGNATGSDTPKTISVPDRVGLEGLEKEFSARWEENRVYALIRTPVIRCTRLTPATNGLRFVASDVFSYTQTDVIARLACAAKRVLSHGLGRQRSAH